MFLKQMLRVHANGETLRLYCRLLSCSQSPLSSVLVSTNVRVLGTRKLKVWQCPSHNQVLISMIGFFFLSEFLLQRTSYRNCRLTVENKNLKNKLKNMEYEICEVKKALSVEDFQCNLLTEQLDLKLVRYDKTRNLTRSLMGHLQVDLGLLNTSTKNKHFMQFLDGLRRCGRPVTT